MSTVAIVDDHPSFAERLGAFVEALPGWSVVGTVEDAETGIELVLARRPDVALVDVGLPEHNGLWFIERAVALLPGLRIILMSNAEPEEYAEAARLAGAEAYVPKYAISRDLPALLNGTGGSGLATTVYASLATNGPETGGSAGRRTAGPAAAVDTTLVQSSTLVWVGLALACVIVLAFIARGEPTFGGAIALALLSILWRWSPSDARRGRAARRGPQRPKGR